LNDRIERLGKRFGEAEEESNWRANEERQRISLRNQHQRIPGKSQDTLVHLAALLERLQDVILARRPRFRRRRQFPGPRESRNLPQQ
jgi:hypothetical protein